MPVTFDTIEVKNSQSLFNKEVADMNYVNQTGDILQGDLDMGHNVIKNLKDAVDQKMLLIKILQISR